MNFSPSPTRGDLPEVLDRLRHDLVEELHVDSARVLSVDLHVEVDAGAIAYVRAAPAKAATQIKVTISIDFECESC